MSHRVETEAKEGFVRKDNLECVTKGVPRIYRCTKVSRGPSVTFHSFPVAQSPSPLQEFSCCPQPHQRGPSCTAPQPGGTCPQPRRSSLLGFELAERATQQAGKGKFAHNIGFQTKNASLQTALPCGPCQKAKQQDSQPARQSQTKWQGLTVAREDMPRVSVKVTTVLALLRRARNGSLPDTAKQRRVWARAPSPSRTMSHTRSPRRTRTQVQLVLFAGLRARLQVSVENHTHLRSQRPSESGAENLTGSLARASLKLTPHAGRPKARPP